MGSSHGRRPHITTLRNLHANRICWSPERLPERSNRGYPMLSHQEMERYQRQMLLFGEKGQLALKDSSVIIAGAGGLGSPVAYYLAVAGVGHIRIVDHDRVERSNLNRQILHRETDIGALKADSAREKLTQINPDILIDARGTTIDAQ